MTVTFDSLNTAELLTDREGDYQSIQLHRQCNGKFTLWIEGRATDDSMSDEAGFRNLSAKDLVALAMDLLEVAAPLLVNKPAVEKVP